MVFTKSVEFFTKLLVLPTISDRSSLASSCVDDLIAATIGFIGMSSLCICRTSEVDMNTED